MNPEDKEIDPAQETPEEETAPVPEEPAAEQAPARSYVQPGFVDAERLDHVGVLIKDLVDFMVILLVFIMMRRHQDQFRTFLPCLPDRFRRFDTVFFCGFIFCQNNAVPVVRIAAYRDRLLL